MMSNTEKQAAFRKRMAEKGFRQKQVRVGTDKTWSSYMRRDKQSFRRRPDEITADMNQSKLSKLYAKILSFVKKEIEK